MDHQKKAEVSQSVPKMGPEPTLISRKEVDALYDILDHVSSALTRIGVDYIVTGGSLLGAVRQHSILFCDDDIDIAIVENHPGRSAYALTTSLLQEELGPDYIYQIRPWEGGDRIRSRIVNTVFVDLFTIQRYESMDELNAVIGIKKNGRPQSEEYVQGIVDKIESSAFSQGENAPLCPFWHFATRKAVEMWPKEVYREYELLPISTRFKFGPLLGIKGPHTPVLLLKRAFGLDCFDVYFQGGSHSVLKPPGPPVPDDTLDELPPLILSGGAWEGGRKIPLEEEHYLPIQPISRSKRRPTIHGKERLFSFLYTEVKAEELIKKQYELQQLENRKLPVSAQALATVQKPFTVYMDGVFDLFHIGHLEAIKRCAELGEKVIIGVTGDADASDYKRPPIISQENRVAVVEAIKDVAYVVCPCPLVVTEAFMVEHGIDLVVHGYANEADALRQEQFFTIAMQLGKFKRIPYYEGMSTTDIIRKIKLLSDDI